MIYDLNVVVGVVYMYINCWYILINIVIYILYYFLILFRFSKENFMYLY